MSIRNDQCKKVCKILDDALANRPQERDTLIVAAQTAFKALVDDGWISVKERLPDKYGWYLCTLKDGRVNCYYWNNKGEWLDNRKKYFFELYNVYSKLTGTEILAKNEGSVYWTDWVIAWKPLPKPYHPKEDSECDE